MSKKERIILILIEICVVVMFTAICLVDSKSNIPLVTALISLGMSAILTKVYLRTSEIEEKKRQQAKRRNVYIYTLVPQDKQDKASNE